VEHDEARKPEFTKDDIRLLQMALDPQHPDFEVEGEYGAWEAGMRSLIARISAAVSATTSAGDVENPEFGR
jgi:hypothetical protein